MTSPQPSCSLKARGSRFESGNSKTGKRGENARGKIEDGGGRPQYEYDHALTSRVDKIPVATGTIHV